MRGCGELWDASAVGHVPVMSLTQGTHGELGCERGGLCWCCHVSQGACGELGCERGGSCTCAVPHARNTWGASTVGYVFTFQAIATRHKVEGQTDGLLQGPKLLGTSRLYPWNQMRVETQVRSYRSVFAFCSKPGVVYWKACFSDSI